MVSLKAVFDACNSATLLGKTFSELYLNAMRLKFSTLDLKHHRCNRVYVPWVNKGFRRTQSQWNNVGESILLLQCGVGMDSLIDKTTASTPVCVYAL